MFSTIFAGLLAAATQSGPVIVTPPAERVYSPREAVFAAADAAPRAVHGTFALRVAAAGREGERVYLNSERDYRDQRNLTINIAPGAVRALTARYGVPPDQYLRGRLVAVRGAAHRQRIDFVDDGRPTRLYYYQTHVDVSDADQISLAESGPSARAQR